MMMAMRTHIKTHIYIRIIQMKHIVEEEEERERVKGW